MFKNQLYFYMLEMDTWELKFLKSTIYKSIKNVKYLEIELTI